MYQLQVWSITARENTEFACRMCTKAWDVGYEELLSTLNLPSSNRRLFLNCALYY